MIRPIMKDPVFLGRASEPAKNCPEDLQTAQDLLETLEAHREGCVGMAANMIGVPKRIICVSVGPMVLTMLNPVIVKKSGAYEAEEGCLSLAGVRTTTRYQAIEVEWQDLSFRKMLTRYEGWTAQIIQHEVDHLEGILI